MRSRSRRIPTPASRRLPVLLAPAVLLGLAGALAASCGRHPAARIDPAAAGSGVAAWRENTAAICDRVASFQSRGTFLVTMNDMRAEASHAFYFQAPDRIRLQLDFPGYLWVPPATGQVLVRGESLYVAVPGLIEPWRGTRPEFLADWSWRAALMLGILAELDPRGPLGCASGGDEADLVLRDRGPKQVSAEGVASGLFWELTLDRATGTVSRLRFRLPEDRDEGRSEWRRFRLLDGLLLPAALTIRWEDQGLLINIEQDEQRLNPPLSADLFDPGGLDAAARGVGG